MKLPLVIVMILGCATWLPAQAPAPGTAYAPEQLDQLLAPIALYPDPLVALVLPAATAPADVVLAARYLAGGGDSSQIDAQPWDDSVKALARYPDVIRWLDANLAFTRALGAAFAQQPADVMQSIQRLRARAVAAGSLASTPQQTVAREGNEICIEPAQDDVIYVPQYDAELVYDVPPGYSGPFLTFGFGFPAGPWLSYECDWDDFGIWVGGWHRHWGYYRDWRSPGAGRPGTVWRPDPRRWPPGRQQLRPVPFERVRPAPMQGAPRAANRLEGSRSPNSSRTPVRPGAEPDRPRVVSPPGQGRAVAPQARAEAPGGKVAAPPRAQPAEKGRGGESRPAGGSAKPSPAAHAAPASAPAHAESKGQPSGGSDEHRPQP